MPTLEELRARLTELREQRGNLAEQLRAITATAVDEKRALTEEESTSRSELRGRIATLDDDIAATDGRIAELAEQERLAELDARNARELRLTGGGQVVTESRTYAAQSGNSFFADAYRAQHSGDVHAKERLDRHAREVEVEREVRATSTSSFAGLIVPQYLVDEYALVARAGRPFANSIPSLTLPAEGMTFQIPRGTTGASVGVQNPENANVSETDEAWSNVSVSVVTIAGQQDVTRQSLERGTPGLDAIVYRDLVLAYASYLDAQLINGSGTGGQHLGVLNTAGINSATAFGASVTGSNFQTKIAGQFAAVMSSRFLAADLIVMHPRRWFWLLSLSDSSGRPLVLPNAQGPFNSLAINQAAQYGSVVGTFQGIPVILDANIPTNVGTNSEDVVLVLRNEDLILWEEDDGMPRQLSFEQTLGNQLTVKLVVYGYSAFTGGRYPSAIGTVGGKDATGGQGLIAPTF